MFISNYKILEESKKIYKQGISIAQNCNQLLKETELEIKDLKEELEKQFDEPQE